MSGIEVYKKINENNKRLKELLNKFVFTNEIKSIIKENNDLKKVCPHEYINGICKYCYSKEHNNDKDN